MCVCVYWMLIFQEQIRTFKVSISFESYFRCRCLFKPRLMNGLCKHFNHSECIFHNKNSASFNFLHCLCLTEYQCSFEVTRTRSMCTKHPQTFSLGKIGRYILPWEQKSIKSIQSLKECRDRENEKKKRE